MGRVAKPAGLYLRNGSWYIDKQVRGLRIGPENLGPVTQRQAEAILSQRVAAAIEQRYFPVRSLTVESVLRTYWDESLSTLPCGHERKYHLSRIADAMGGEDVLKLSWPRVLRYAVERKRDYTRQGEPISTRTVTAELEHLHMALIWQRDNHGLQVERWPFPSRWKSQLRKRWPASDAEPHTFSAREWWRIYRHANESVRLALLTQWETGMRASEIVGLRPESLRVFASEIELAGGLETKNRRRRTIAVSRKLMALLAARAGTNRVFEQDNGRPYTYSWLRSGLRRAAARAGVQLPRWAGTHSLRRTRVTIWNELDPEAAMAMAGHTDARTHRKYVRISPERRRRLVENSNNSPTPKGVSRDNSMG